jgi:hypothetical protein
VICKSLFRYTGVGFCYKLLQNRVNDVEAIKPLIWQRSLLVTAHISLIATAHEHGHEDSYEDIQGQV